MAQFELKFIDCVERLDYIEVNIDAGVIRISGLNDRKLFEIMLDKSTAIKFAKTLRTEINKITEIETDYVDLFKDKIETVVKINKEGVINND
jgi:hypothetical protein